MSKNLKIKLVVAIFCAVVFLLIFEMFIYNRRKEVDEKSIEIQKQIEKMQSTTVYTEQQKIYNYINEIVNLMNKKDYKTLYGMLKEDYKSYFFSEYDQFETYIKKYAAIEYVPKYTSYYREKNKYIVIVDFLRKEYDRNDLVNNVPNKYDIITVEKLNNDEYRFALGNFIETEQYGKSEQIDDLEFTLSRGIRYAEQTELNVLIKNKSNKKIYINGNNIKINVDGGNVAVLSSLPLTIIEPSSTLAVDVEFYMKYDSIKEFKGCTFTGIKSEDGVIYEDVSITI